MEDSGFDSDQRSIQNGIDIVNKQTNTTDTVSPKTKPMNVVIFIGSTLIFVARHGSCVEFGPT